MVPPTVREIEKNCLENSHRCPLLAPCSGCDQGIAIRHCPCLSRPWGRWPPTPPHGGQTNRDAMPADPPIVAPVGTTLRISSAKPSRAKHVTTFEQVV